MNSVKVRKIVRKRKKMESVRKFLGKKGKQTNEAKSYYC